MLKAIMEKDLDPRELPYIQQIYPNLYHTSQANTIFTVKNFMIWLGYGTIHSLIVFFVSLLASNKVILTADGKESGIWCLSLLVYTAAIVVVTQQIIFYTRYWTIYHQMTIWVFSLGIYFSWVFVYDWFSFNKTYVTALQLFQSMNGCWLPLLMSTVLCFIIDFYPKMWMRWNYPTKEDEVRMSIANNKLPEFYTPETE